MKYQKDERPVRVAFYIRVSTEEQVKDGYGIEYQTQDLIELVKHAGESGEMHLEFDVKPDYRDTPRNWQWVLEGAFTQGLSYG